MMYLKRLKYILNLFAFVIFTLALNSCASDDFTKQPKPVAPGYDLDNSLVVNLSVDTGVEVLTKADDNGYEKGDERDHYINFDDPNQCYVIFFRENKTTGETKFLYITQLFYNDQVGSGRENQPEDNTPIEHEVPVYAIIPRPENYQVGADNESLPNKALVVLNGALLKTQFVELGKTLGKGDNDVAVFLNEIWVWEHYKDEVPAIGINKNGHFTMTNSAYLDDKGKLMTAATLDPTKYCLPTWDNMKKAPPAGTIYVERMVAKFSPPTFGTDVIGSDKVFRPSQNALSMIIYQFNDKNELVSEQKNWRIHLLGWTINGRETSNYIFKKIPGKETDLYGWAFTDESDPTKGWNYPAHKRSYWSIDPHYGKNEKDFYPWQYRESIDIQEDISLFPRKKDWEKYISSYTLRYFSFNEVKTWNNYALTISENTFDPSVFTPNKESVYDGRATLLAGPHLLVTAEVYIESKQATDDDYLGSFSTVDNLYSDRLRRFYLTEKDWFKMFIRDFNRALETQEVMSFKNYNWDKTGSQDDKTYTVVPTGSCRLYINRPDLADKIKFKNKELTYELLDDLIIELNKIGEGISVAANVKDGDGRLIPWIDGLLIRDANENRVPIYDENGVLVPDDHIDRDDMRKSLFYEWFGPVDHYVNGYMYYAGDIKHHASDDGGTDFYGAVRNHWYKFKVNSINSLGTPIDDPDQPIIPARYNYQGMISVYLDVLDWHTMTSEIEFED